jgi:hypothetical protein
MTQTIFPGLAKQGRAAVIANLTLPEPPPSATHRTCEVCGAAATVRILEGYQNSKPILRSFCLVCASSWKPS